MDGTEDTQLDDASVAKTRARREKKDTHGRFAALARLKKAKETGEKLKYEVVAETDVYDEVDEKEYAKIVQGRQEDDWIIDDDGCGYVEDGREIFDEDLADADVVSKGEAKGKGKKRQNPNIRAPDSKPKSIKSMFAAAAVKPKRKVEKDVDLNEDAILGDIMSELHQGSNSDLMPASVKLVKKKATPKVVANPFATKSTPKRRNPVKAITPRNVSSEINSAEVEVPPTKPIQPPAKIMKTALDKFDDFEYTPDISEFSTQEVSTVTPTQIIDDSETEKENGAVDVSGINFEDDFGEMEGITNGEKMDTTDDPGHPELEFDDLKTSWETVKGDSIPLPTDIDVDSSKLPLTTNEEGEQVLRMYWLDAYEDHYKQPGVVYLFGKVWIDSAKTHVSCCVAVKNIERMACLLPRKTRLHPKTGEITEKPVTFVDVYQEFNEQIAEKYKIMKFKSMKSVKKYAFDKADVPVESEYLVVKYSAEYPALPQDLKGETFSCVFGTNTSSMETLLLERKMKGPSWIDIKLPQMPNPVVSWCKVEAFVSKPEHVTVVTGSLPLPPLVVMTMSLKTLPNPKTHQNEIISVASLVQHQFNMDKPAPKPAFQDHFCAITKPNECVFPYDFKEKAIQQSKNMKVDVMGNERALLGFLLAKIHKLDPDIIVGHDAFAFDIDVLLHRISSNKIPHWSRIGRLKRANMPRLSNNYGSKNSSSANATCGRLVCDVKISAKELIRCRSYDLSELVSHVLSEKRVEVDVDKIKMHYSNSQSLLKLIELILVDATFILRIMYELMVIPLALQITNICGNVIARTLMGGRAERNEYLLLHAFTEKGFIVPDKAYGNKKQVVEENEDEDHETTKSSNKSTRRKPAYAGGLVLDPKKGFYDKYILLLDFNSLYPTIIQEFNICFTTISRDPSVGQAVADGDDLDVILPEPGLEPGILPTEIRKLVQSRRQVKALMKQSDISSELYMQYDIRQLALKLTANSMYGCLGFSFSRFYAKPLAALVTGKGREILMQTKDLVQAMNLEVIYGDTDSIMVNSNCTDLDQVYKLGNKIKTEVNKMYRLLEIDIDGVFKSMLLLKKKKYAALTVQKVGDTITFKEEMKGLDIVRRDWCVLAKQAGKYAVEQILSGQPRETILENIHNKLTDVGEQVKSGGLDLELYHITKSLTKNPEDYPDKKSLPHVQVALRMNSKGGKKLCGGDIVYYVICDDGSNLPHSQRGYHPEELAKRNDLTIDTKYYLAQQILPVVSRLCDPIDGTDQARLAECLGLDPSGYRQAMMVRSHDEDDAMSAGQESDEEKYKNCDRFKFNCPPCGKEIIFDGVFSSAGQYLEYKLGKCPNGDCKVQLTDHAGRIMNKLTCCVREHIKKYYEGWLKCEDSACGVVTRKVPQIYQRGHPVCTTCMKGRLYPEYSDGMLYRQLSFYLYVFDIEKAVNNLDEKERGVANKHKNDFASVYDKIQQHIKSSLNLSAYSQVSLARLFEGLMPIK